MIPDLPDLIIRQGVVNPARAGMIRRDRQYLIKQYSKPRASGDDPGLISTTGRNPK